MKYLENNQELGILPVDDDITNLIIENLGLEREDEEVPNIIAVDEDLFALSPEVTVIEDSLCIKLEELSENIFEAVREEPELTEYIEFDDELFFFEGLVESEGHYYVSLLHESDIETDEDESDDYVMEINGVEYNVVDDEDYADSYAFLVEDEEGNYLVVDDEEDADYTVYLSQE